MQALPPFAAKGVHLMTDLQDRDRQPDDPRYAGEHRYRDPELPSMHTLNRRMLFWELANGVLCVLFLWAPMAAAAFPR